jgi:putative membrane protein
MTPEHADVVRPIMFNQGFYNLFLATGVIVGVAMSTREGTTATQGTAVAVFGLACMTLAGVVLALTGPTMRRAAAVQATPPVVALALIAVLSLT